MVRQSNNFTVKNAYVRVFNPNQTAETFDDEVLACSGKLVYFEPTRNRMLAWRNAFKSWLANRKLLGVKYENADFRVGFADNYSTNVGAFNEGVKYNAWIKDEEDPLMLTCSDDIQRSIFGVWNEQQTRGTNPDPQPTESFGTWIDPNAGADFDELDFVAHQNSYFTDGAASETAQTAPFQVNFSAWFDNATSDPDDFGSATNAQVIQGPIKAMNGLIGVYVDTVTVDDSSSENQDIGIEVTLDIQKWDSIWSKLKSKSRRKSRKSRRRR